MEAGLVALWWLVRHGREAHLRKTWSQVSRLTVWQSPHKLCRWHNKDQASTIYVLLTTRWKAVYVGMVQQRSPQWRWREHLKAIQTPPKGDLKYKCMRRKAKAGSWWMLPIVDFTTVVEKRQLLRVEAWAMTQFHSRLNGLHGKMLSKTIHERSNRPVKGLLPQHKHKRVEQTQFQGWTFAGCIGPEGTTHPLNLALAAHWPMFLCNPPNLNRRAETKRIWGRSTLMWFDVQIDWHSLKISEYSNHSRVGTVRRFLRENKQSWVIVIVLQRREHKLSDETIKHLLGKLLVASCKNSRYISSEFTTIQLWRLWGKVGRLHLESERRKIRAQITAALRLKGLNITPGGRIRLCCPVGTNSRIVRKLMRLALSKSRLHTEIATKIKISVTAAKTLTGVDLMLDHKSWINMMKASEPLECQCHICPEHWNTMLGHKVCRSQTLWNWSLRSPLVRDRRSIGIEAHEALWAALEKHVPEFTLEGVNLWHSGRRLHADSRWLAIHTEASHNTEGLQWSKMVSIKRITKDLAKVPIDKAPGEILICCPRYYEKLFDKSFVVDGVYYGKEDRDPKEVLNHLRNQWKRNKWAKLGAWDNNGEFPTPYIMPKSKNLEKARPIIPYTKHPLRKVYSTVGTAHSFLMKKLPHNLSFNIMDTAEFANRVSIGILEGRRRFGDQLAWKCMFGDLSNMYTELRHEAIESATKWGLKQSKLCSRINLVAVDKRHRIARKGRAWAAGTAEVDLHTIEEVSNFDNAHMFLWIKGTLVRQCHGCPMGSNLSPPKAMVTCSPPEANFIKELKRHNALAIHARFMDDVGILIAYNSDDALSERLATDLCERVKHMYPAPLVLETVEPIRGRYKFLESIVQIQGGDILVRHCAPTRQSRPLYGTAPPRLELHPGCEEEVLLSRLVCEWHRAARNSVQKTGLLVSVWERCLTLIHSGHPTAVLHKSLRIMSNLDRPEKVVWRCATGMISVMLWVEK